MVVIVIVCYFCQTDVVRVGIFEKGGNYPPHFIFNALIRSLSLAILSFKLAPVAHDDGCSLKAVLTPHEVPGNAEVVVILFSSGIGPSSKPKGESSHILMINIFYWSQLDFNLYNILW